MFAALGDFLFCHLSQRRADLHICVGADLASFIQRAISLKLGSGIEGSAALFVLRKISQETKLIRPAKVIIVEGILILADPQLCQEMDIRVFVDTDADVRILRRIVRDVNKRGRTLESVVDQYLTTVKPMHEAFVEPSKKNAHIIIPEGGRNQVALDMLMERIKAQLSAE